MDEPKKRAFHCYLAGVTHLIYAESSSEMQWLYSKIKLFRHKAMEYLLEAHELDPRNSYCSYYLALASASLSKP